MQKSQIHLKKHSKTKKSISCPVYFYHKTKQTADPLVFIGDY